MIRVGTRFVTFYITITRSPLKRNPDRSSTWDSKFGCDMHA